MAVYGYRKTHARLIGQSWDGIGRDQVLRVMRSLGIQGARRGQIPAATRSAGRYRPAGTRVRLPWSPWISRSPGRPGTATPGD
ncbi:IS3 family transposase [Bifidobacterium tibiigranuli]|uniref:IS3 family transposase n=1 Tax=Bifidobacterium tibiigranuli TaxID=2172043 RepID=UPI003C6C0318